MSQSMQTKGNFVNCPNPIISLLHDHLKMWLTKCKPTPLTSVTGVQYELLTPAGCVTTHIILHSRLKQRHEQRHIYIANYKHVCARSEQIDTCDRDALVCRATHMQINV